MLFLQLGKEIAKVLFLFHIKVGTHWKQENNYLQLQLFSPSPRQSDVCTTKEEADENEVITSYVSEPVGEASI